jgi:hypothetical protein
MIAEYLLPVVAAIFIGALSAKTRSSLFALMHGTADAAASAQALYEGSAAAQQFPVGWSGGSFSGSSGGATRIGGNPATENLYVTLAAEIRSTTHAPGKPDPLHAARRAMTDGLGVRARRAPWLARLQRFGEDALKTASVRAQKRLRELRSRLRDNS